MKVKIESIKQMGERRPKGYFEDVMAHGTVHGDFLEIDHKSYSELLAKYRPASLGIIQQPCCGKASPSGSFPPLMTQVKNVMGAAGRVAHAVLDGKQVKASETDVKKRLEICQVCEFNKNDRCLKCGCYWKIKMSLETEHCPIGKW